MELFSFSLLDPLKSAEEARHVMGDSLDDILDSAINLEQKRVNVTGLLLFCFQLLSYIVSWHMTG